MMLTRLRFAVPDTPHEIRTSEPLTVGLPFPEGMISDLSTLELRSEHGESVSLQWKILERWPSDGSVRWALLDCQLDAPGACTLHSGSKSSPSHKSPIRLTTGDHEWRLETAGVTYLIAKGTNALFDVTDRSTRRRSAVLRVLGNERQEHSVEWTSASIELNGPIRTTLRLDGVVGSLASPLLLIVARLSWFADVRDVRVELTLHNPRRAQHRGGFWELGDPGSFFFSDASLLVDSPGGYDEISLSDDRGHILTPVAAPVLLYQESSGGEHWKSPVHVNRHGKVPLRFRGYEVRADGVARHGDRATPVLAARGANEFTAAGVRDFWQNFPKALEANAGSLRIGLFPGEVADLYELQGGEQKTHVIGLAFADGSVAMRPVDWILRPALAGAEPEWYCAARALPYLTPASTDPNDQYLAFIQAAIEGPESFERKRERIDEYGWRNFGDLFADHESAYKADGPPFVSHYNNQYDATAGFATQFMRSGDPRWWTAMDQLARHVVDIDVYRARDDKSAYSGGLFWHTAHYVDAGLSSHRAYPSAPGVHGGGPSNEHCYSTGLMLYFFMTGHEWARTTAVQLANWVLQIDCGRLTPFRWLSGGPTGLASSTFSPDYHGPGRGAGNAIVTLLNGFRLTHDRQYIRKAEELIRRCIHPSDEAASRDLLNAEARWSYTVFLQALGKYLDEKILLGELDCWYAYARASLLQYARWMADNEYPYLEKPEILEFPTETWAAQDMRKSDVLTVAARHAISQDKAKFLERAEFFFTASLNWLNRFPSRFYSRPVVILLSCGYSRAAAARDGLPGAPEPTAKCDHGVPTRFVPQKQVAIRRAKWGLALVAATVGGIALWLATQLAAR